MYIFVGQVNIKMIGRLFFFPLGPASIEGSPARGNREKLGQFCALLYPASSFKTLTKIWESALSDETTDKVSKTILHTVLYVANELLNQRAMLLPHVSQVFLKEYFQSVPEDTDYTLEGPECTIKFSSKWLLEKLLAHLDLHMEYKCVHKKFGTLLYNKNRDLLVSLYGPWVELAIFLSLHVISPWGILEETTPKQRYSEKQGK